jgi:hypothetical protein
VATLCFHRGSSVYRTPLPFSMVKAERRPPQSSYFALVNSKVPVRAYIKNSIQKELNPLLPNYVGHIGRKPVYEGGVYI